MTVEESNLLQRRERPGHLKPKKRRSGVSMKLPNQGKLLQQDKVTQPSIQSTPDQSTMDKEETEGKKYTIQEQNEESKRGILEYLSILRRSRDGFQVGPKFYQCLCSQLHPTRRQNPQGVMRPPCSQYLRSWNDVPELYGISSAKLVSVWSTMSNTLCPKPLGAKQLLQLV